MESEGRNEVQSAYRVLVASTAEALAADEGDLWDSGKVSWSDNMNGYDIFKALTTGRGVSQTGGMPQTTAAV